MPEPVEGHECGILAILDNFFRIVERHLMIVAGMHDESRLFHLSQETRATVIPHRHMCDSLQLPLELAVSGR